MKLSCIKKLFGIAACAVMTASSVQFTASAADQQERGNIGGYDYEMWNMNYEGEVEFEPGLGSFSCSWKNISNFIASMGKYYDKQKNYKELESLSFSYDVEFSPRGNAYFGAYGWQVEPLSEYYIIDGWGSWRPSGTTNVKKYGTAIVNGNEYDVFTAYRYNQPSIYGTRSFQQYWSVRTESASKDNVTNYINGSIDISKHFASWEAFGLDTSGNIYESSFYVEGYDSSGKAVLKSLHFGAGRDSSPVCVNGKYLKKDVYIPHDSDGYYIRDDFSENIGDWEAREDAQLSITPDGYNGTNCLLVSERTTPWDGASLYLGSKTFRPHEKYSFGAVVMQDSEPSEEMELMLEYRDRNNETNYIVIDKKAVKKGEWTELSHPYCELNIPEGAKDLVLFIDSFDDICDLYIDNVYVAAEGTKTFSSPDKTAVSDLPGDINCDGAIDVFDLAPLRRGILNMIVDNAAAPANSDVNKDGKVNVADLVFLQRYLLGAEKLPVQETSVTTTVADDTTSTTTSAATTTTIVKAQNGSYAFSAQYLKNTGKEDAVYPSRCIIESREELESYMADNEVFSSDDPVFSDVNSFSAAVTDYTDEWFSTHKLAVVLLKEIFSAPDTYKVTNVTGTEVEIERLKNGGDMSIAYWYILIELDKDADIKNDFNIQIKDNFSTQLEDVK